MENFKNTFKIRSLSDINDITYASYTFYPSIQSPCFSLWQLLSSLQASSGRKSLTPRAFNKPLAFNLARYRENDLRQPEKNQRCLAGLASPSGATWPPQRPKKVIALPRGVAILQSNHWASQQALRMGASGYNQQINVTNPGKWPAKELSRKNPKVSWAVGIIWQLFRFYSLSDQNGGAITAQIAVKEILRYSLNIR